jgi:hypothetical protein
MQSLANAINTKGMETLSDRLGWLLEAPEQNQNGHYNQCMLGVAESGTKRRESL